MMWEMETSIQILLALAMTKQMEHMVSILVKLHGVIQSQSKKITKFTTTFTKPM